MRYHLRNYAQGNIHGLPDLPAPVRAQINHERVHTTRSVSDKWPHLEADWALKSKMKKINLMKKNRLNSGV